MSRHRSTDQDSRPTRRRRWSRAVVALTALASLAALIVWLGRDLPRQWIEQRLASMLDAEVRLQRLEIDNLHHFVLRGVEVRQVGWESRIGRLSIERLEVDAPIRQALNGRYEKLTVDGVEVRLVPPTRPAEPVPKSEIQAGQIEIRHGLLVATSGEHETRIEFAALLTEWGKEPPTGHLSFTAERLDTTPLLAVLRGPAGDSGGRKPETLAATAEMLRVDAYLQSGEEPLRVESEAGLLRLQYGDRTVELRQPGLEAAGVRDDRNDVLRLKILPTVRGIEAAALEVVLDNESYALRSGHAELRGMDIETLLEAGSGLPDHWTVDGLVDLLVRTDDGQSFAYEVETELDRLELPLGTGLLASEKIRATTRGRWDGNTVARDPRPLTHETEATLGTLRIVAGSTEFSATGSRIAAGGKLEATGDGEVRARVTLSDGRGRHGNLPIPEDLFPVDALLEGTLTFAARPVFEGTSELLSPLLGRLRIRGRTDFQRDRPLAHWRWDWSDAPDLPALRRTASQLGFGVSPSGIDAGGRPSARGSLQGALADPGMQGQLTIEQFRLSPTAGFAIDAIENWKLERARASTGFSRRAGDGGRIDFDALEVDGHVSHASGDRSPGEMWTRALLVTATGRAAGRSGELQLDDARIDIPGFASMQIKGRLEADRSLSLTAQLEPVALSEIRELSHLWLEDLAPDYTLKGTVASELDVQRTSAGIWHTRADVDLLGSGFGSGDGARVLEGAEARWKIALSSRPGGGIEGEATATMTGPVMLWGTLFGDFSRLPSEIQVRASRDGGRWESTASWQLPDGVAVRGRLAAEPGPRPGLDAEADDRVDARPHLVEYALSADVPDLSAFLEHYVQGPFEGSVEHLDTLRAAGRLRVDLDGVIDETRHAVEGAVEATDTSFTGVEGATAIEGLKLDLPISLGWRRIPDGIDDLVPGPQRTGSLAYERLRLDGLEFPALDTRLVVSSDTVRLDRPVNLSLLDGRLELQQVALTRWSRPDRDLRFSLRLDELSLAALTLALDTFPLSGTLSGTFPAVHLTPDRLQVDGGGTIQVFGGAVKVYDISGQDVLSRLPKLQFSARFDGIHLLDVTRTFDFGEVFGVVNGEIRDCQLFGGALFRCQAELGSIKTRGVPQKISVKAIRNISILGAGPRVGFLDRGLQKFLDTYTYSRLGFTMKLDNDRFLLRGNERRGTRELFVKGRLPFRIDIVNAAPGQTVSFQTMMGRLQNLQVAAPSKKAPNAAPLAPDTRPPLD